MTDPALHSSVAATTAGPRAVARPRPRDASIDNLRVALTMLVVGHHAIQPYGFNHNWWVVERVPSVPLFGLFMWINASFFMGLFFLVAGLVTPASLARKGPGSFVRDRTIRLGVPLIFGFFVLIPLVSWVAHLHNRHMAPVGYGEYFAHYFLGLGPRPADWPDAHWPDAQFGHLWFLQHLLLYGLLYAAWRRLQPAPTPGPAGPPGNTAIALYALGLGLVTWVVRMRWPQDTWTGLLGFIQTEPAHLPQYVSLFALGVAGGRRRWLARLPATTGRRWLCVGLGLAVLQIVRTAWTRSFDANNLETCLWEAFLCVGLCIGLLIACRERWNRAGWMARVLAPEAYTVYILHIAVVVALQYAMLDVALGGAAKAAIVVPASIAFSFALGYLVVRYVPGATRVL